MTILVAIKQAVGRVGIKEVARRSGLSASTVSRISASLIKPSFEVVERISEALGLHMELHPNHKWAKAPRLSFAKNNLSLLRNELRTLGVKHAVIYGSVARGEDGANSDIDVYLDFGLIKPKIGKLLKAEGRIIESFGNHKVDIISNLSSQKGQRLKVQIDKDGVYAF